MHVDDSKSNNTEQQKKEKNVRKFIICFLNNYTNALQVHCRSDSE